MRTMITPDSGPLRRKDIAALVAKFKRRNPGSVQIFRTFDQATASVCMTCG